MKRSPMGRGQGNPIPDESRRIVEKRERNLCARCGGRGMDWHHRRRREIRDVHQHCACNGVFLCRTCHQWAHAHPVQARAQGFIVSGAERSPHTVPQLRLDGWWLLLCDGTGQALRHDQVLMRGGVPTVA